MKSELALDGCSALAGCGRRHMLLSVAVFLRRQNRIQIPPAFCMLTKFVG
jgi:hypothetical protein